MKKIIIFDNGHGGWDSGCIGVDGILEKNVVLSHGIDAKKDMENRYEGVEVILTRSNDTFVSLDDRSILSNNKKADLFVSRHMNAPKTAIGFEVFSGAKSSKGTEVAHMLHKEFQKENLLIVDRGVKHKLYSVLRKTIAPAILIEYCFLGNTKDYNHYKANRDKIIRVENDVFAKYLGLKKKKGTNSETVVGDKLHKVQVGAYLDRENADIKLDELLADGFDGFIKLPYKDNLFRVQTGVFRNKKGAYDLLDRLEKKGHKGFIVIEEKEVDPIPADRKSKYIQIGDAKIIKTTPDNIYIPTLGETLFDKWVYGVNGTFFDTKTAPVKSPNSCVYIAINNGKAISGNAQFNGWKGPPRGTIYYTKDGRLGNRRVKSVNELPKNTDWAIGGVTIKPYMQFKDEKIGSSISRKTAHTYIGYDDKGYLYLIVKPNHRPSEIVPVLDKLGIKQCIMLDGGGSSQFNHEGGTIRSTRKINTAVLLKTK